mmetsp:Transcript_13656/g.20370  ORF Transcript_13656/g.20370 Transcript_13656/m.20370 type:complete len:445 (-) Transcript_13656:118-1452(-)
MFLLHKLLADRHVVERVALASIESMARVAIICGLGGIMARINVLDSTARKAIASLLTYLLQPALLFTKVSAAVARAGGQIVHWFILPAYVVFHVALGLFLAKIALICWIRFLRRKGRLGSKKLSFSPLPSIEEKTNEIDDDIVEEEIDEVDWEFAILAMASTFPNGGSLCYAIVDSLCATKSSVELLGDDRDSCLHSTIGYISFYLSFLSPTMWLVIPNLFKPKNNKSIELTTRQNEGVSPQSNKSNPQPNIIRRCFSRILAIPPPVLAAIVGALIGAIPGLRKLLLENGNDGLNVLGSALNLVGESAIPTGMINLGGAIAANAFRSDHNSQQKKMPTQLIFAAGLFRLFIIPIFSILLTATLRFHNLFVLRRDAPLTLVLMLEAIPPPAMQCMIIVQLFNQSLERPLAQTLVSLYFVGIITLTLWIAIILSILAADESAVVQK